MYGMSYRQGSRKFFILALPRSRTAWLANFLTYGPSFCFHEGLVGCQSISDLRRKMASIDSEVVGNSDCGNILLIDHIVKEFPNAKFVVIHRDLQDVEKSLFDIGLDCNQYIHDAFSAIKRLKIEAMHVNYDDIGLRECRAIWQWCVGTEMNDDRYYLLNKLDIQIFPEDLVIQVSQEKDSMNKLIEVMH